MVLKQEKSPRLLLTLTKRIIAVFSSGLPIVSRPLLNLLHKVDESIGHMIICLNTRQDPFETDF